MDRTKRLKRIQFGTGETGPIYIDDVSLVGVRKLLVTWGGRPLLPRKKATGKPRPKR